MFLRVTMTAAILLVSGLSAEARADLFQIAGTIGDGYTAGAGQYDGPSLLADGSFSGTFSLSNRTADIAEYLPSGARFDTLTSIAYIVHNYLGGGIDIVDFSGARSDLYLFFASPFDGTGFLISGLDDSPIVETYTADGMRGESPVVTAVSGPVTVPEPSTAALVAVGGALGLLAARRRRGRQRSRRRASATPHRSVRARTPTGSPAPGRAGPA